MLRNIKMRLPNWLLEENLSIMVFTDGLKVEVHMIIIRMTILELAIQRVMQYGQRHKSLLATEQHLRKGLQKKDLELQKLC